MSDSKKGFSRRELFNRGAIAGAGILAAGDMTQASNCEPKKESVKDDDTLRVAA